MHPPRLHVPQASALLRPPDTLTAMLCRRAIYRLTTAMLVVCSLLFSQLALARYVCPGAADAGVSGQTMAQKMAAGEPCTGMDEPQPVLCHQHCTGSPQSFEIAKLATPTMPAIVQVLTVPVVFDAHRIEAAPRAQALVVRAPPDPLFLATLRLRV